MNKLSKICRYAVTLCLVLFLTSCQAQHPFEVMAELPYPPVNAAVSPEGRIFMSFQEGAYSVAELMPDGSLQALNNLEIEMPFGLQVEGNERLWLLDASADYSSPSLLSWNIQTERVERQFFLPKTDKPLFFQDFALDLKHRKAYIADMGLAAQNSQPALWSVDLESGQYQALFTNPPQFRAELETMVIDGRPFQVRLPGGVIEPELGLNPITIDANYEWVYLGAMKGRTLYRISTEVLNDARLSEQDRLEALNSFADKPYSDGITIDDEGRIYVTDLEASGIGVIEGGEYRLLFSDSEQIQWPDDLSCMPDSKLLLMTNQLYLQALYNAGVKEASPPYLVIQFDALGSCQVGR